MRNVRIEATAALAAMLLFGLSASGAAQEEAGPIEETGRLAVAEAAVGVAEHLDVSVQEAIDQTWWQPALAELLAELDEDGVGYLGTRVDGTGARAYVVVAFSGEAPRRIVEHALADLGVIEIVEGVGIDRRELVRMMTDVHLAVEEAGLDVRVELDEIAGRLSITTGEPMDEQTLAAVRAIAGDRVADTLVGEVGPDELEG